MIRAYKYKMKPTVVQAEYFSKCFGCMRYVYNYALSEKIKAYSDEKKTLSFFDLCALVRALRKDNEHKWLNEVPALSLNYSLLNPAYIHGRRSSGYFVVKDFEGHTLSNSTSYKSLGLVRHSGSFLIDTKKRNQGSIPPPSKDGSILEHLL